MELGSIADWVSAVGTIGALLGAAWAIRLQTKELAEQRRNIARSGEMADRNRRIDTTLQMHRFWSDAATMERRYAAWAFLDSIEARTQPALWGDIDPSARQDLADVHHFIAANHALARQNLLDRGLAKQLYGRTLLRYIERVDRLIEFAEPDEITASFDGLRRILQAVDVGQAAGVAPAGVQPP
ncbi:MAG: hypothetical protein AAGD35_22700 [Actinomycetota bacterium]